MSKRKPDGISSVTPGPVETRRDIARSRAQAQLSFDLTEFFRSLESRWRRGKLHERPDPAQLRPAFERYAIGIFDAEAASQNSASGTRADPNGLKSLVSEVANSICQDLAHWQEAVNQAWERAGLVVFFPLEDDLDSVQDDEDDGNFEATAFTMPMNRRQMRIALCSHLLTREVQSLKEKEDRGPGSCKQFRAEVRR